jgi:peptidoglycan/xylan/chitin deacetylase (PgdA/CDA1 family)
MAPAGWQRAPQAKVPVLMYHVIDTPPPGAPLPALWVSRQEFADQVRALAAKGYRGVTLQQVWDAWHRGGPLPAKPIVFSFDDGYRSHYTNALPILRAQGWPGVLNLEVAVLHVDLRPPAVRKLIDAGWEVDAHTMTHPDLRASSASDLRYQVAGSRSWIRTHFHVPVNFFCYPAGRYDARVVSAVRSAGYLAATTTAPGIATPGRPRFELPRVRVNRGDGVPGLERALAQAGAAGG